MRINVNKKVLPGIQGERTLSLGTEMRRDAIFASGVYIGEIVYVRRCARMGDEYGWRPAKAAPQVKLTDKAGAIRRLPQFDGQDA